MSHCTGRDRFAHASTASANHSTIGGCLHYPPPGCCSRAHTHHSTGCCRMVHTNRQPHISLHSHCQSQTMCTSRSQAPLQCSWSGCQSIAHIVRMLQHSVCWIEQEVSWCCCPQVTTLDCPPDCHRFGSIHWCCCYYYHHHYQSCLLLWWCSGLLACMMDLASVPPFHWHTHCQSTSLPDHNTTGIRCPQIHTPHSMLALRCSTAQTRCPISHQSTTHCGRGSVSLRWFGSTRMLHYSAAGSQNSMKSRHHTTAAPPGWSHPCHLVEVRSHSCWDGFGTRSSPVDFQPTQSPSCTHCCPRMHQLVPDKLPRTLPHRLDAEASGCIQ